MELKYTEKQTLVIKILEGVFNDKGLNFSVSKIEQGNLYQRFYLNCPIEKYFELNKIEDVIIDGFKKYNIEFDYCGIWHNKKGLYLAVRNEKIDFPIRQNIANSDLFLKDKSKISIPIGADFYGKDMIKDLTELGNCLVYGSSGSGASLFMQNFLYFLMQKYEPEKIKLSIIDVVGIDLSRFFETNYNFNNEVYTKEKSILGLKKLARESIYRYHKMKEIGANNIDEYNASEEVKSGKREFMPYIVVPLYDFLGELFDKIEDSIEIEEYISQITEYSKTSGIYIVAFFGRPFTITDNIAQCFNTQIIFCSNVIANWSYDKNFESKNLLGLGDMFLCQKGKEKERLLCYFGKDEEIDEFLKNK